MASGVLDRFRSWLFAEEEEETELPALETEREAEPRRRKTSLLSLHSSRNDEIFVRWPKDREDARICADCLRARRAVVVNLTQLDTNQALRVFDFLTGAAYALGGQIEQAGEGIFLLTPKDIEILSESPHSPEGLSSWQETQ
jgi:cell division inhibitor SepF